MKIQRKQGAKVAHSVTAAASRPNASVGLAALAKAREESHELGHEDERPRRGLGETEPIEHLARAQPPIRLDRLLGHIGQHRIGAAERDDGKLGKEERDVRGHMRTSEDRSRQEQGQNPDREPEAGGLQRA